MSPEEKPSNPADPAPPAAKPDPDAEKTPAEIRAEIDATRDEPGDPVGALAAKTDVKAQAKAKVEDVKAQAQDKAEEAKALARELTDQAIKAAPESPQEAQALVRQNPRPFAIAGGIVILLLLWRWLRS